MKRLQLLLDEVATTTGRITASQPEWPCRRGCDHCCRSLAEPMRMTRPEWERLQLALSALDEDARATMRARLHEPRTCPLLDRETGACTVYDGRPVACRTYGFYAGREGGRWCLEIEARDDLTSSVVLGNHDVIETALEPLGETRTLAEWWTPAAPPTPLADNKPTN